MTQKYSVLLGIAKTGKNFLVLWGPAILAFLLKVPEEYGALAGLIAYFIKNYIENK